jgi:hypothetical protein
MRDLLLIALYNVTLFINLIGDINEILTLLISIATFVYFTKSLYDKFKKKE